MVAMICNSFESRLSPRLFFITMRSLTGRRSAPASSYTLGP